MNLQEIFDQLSSAEFSQLDLGGGDVGVNGRDYKRLTGSINLALADLHTRFLLKTGKLTLQLQLDQTSYLLDSFYAAANDRSVSAIRYIRDTATSPFLDDILLIEQVLDDEDEILPLNEIDNEDSLHTPDYRTLEFPEVTSDMDQLEYTVKYRKGHRLIVEDDWSDPEDTEIHLPYSYMQALCLFVAARHFMPIASGAEPGQQGNNYFARYEAECIRIANGGQQIYRTHTANKFTARGFA